MENQRKATPRQVAYIEQLRRKQWREGIEIHEDLSFQEVSKMIEGLMETFLAACSIMVLVPRNPVTHASPLGRAHIAPGQPWARLAAIGPSFPQEARGRGT